MTDWITLRARFPADEYEEIDQQEGYRIISLSQLAHHISEISSHAVTCSEARLVEDKGMVPMKLVTESRRLGLASVLLSQCQGCYCKFYLHTSHKVDTDDGKHCDINIRAV